jgi:hypothetical protein
MALNLKTLFTDVGKTFKRAHERNIKVDQCDIFGHRMPLIKASTAKARASKIGAQKKMARIGNKAIVARTGKVRKSIAKSVPMTRLLFTERFWRGAFKFTAYEQHVEVFVSSDAYPIREGEKPIRFDEIVEYNNGKPSVIFPRTIAEVEQMPAFKEAEARIKDLFFSGALGEQIFTQALQAVQKEININL